MINKTRARIILQCSAVWLSKKIRERQATSAQKYRKATLKNRSKLIPCSARQWKNCNLKRQNATNVTTRSSSLSWNRAKRPYSHQSINSTNLETIKKSASRSKGLRIMRVRKVRKSWWWRRSQGGWWLKHLRENSLGRWLVSRPCCLRCRGGWRRRRSSG